MNKYYKNGLSRIRSNAYRHLFPEKWVSRIDIVRSYGLSQFLRRNSVDPVFIHVPRCAGTSIATALYGHKILHVRASEFQLYYPTRYRNAHTFSVVRNPWDRLYSAYVFLFSGGTEDLRADYRLEYLDDDFLSFERFVKNWLIKRDLLTCDHVLQPQHMYVCKDDCIIVDDVYKFENIDSLFSMLSQRYGVALFNKLNATCKPPYVSAYDNEMIDIVGAIYARDVELFQYSFV